MSKRRKSNHSREIKLRATRAAAASKTKIPRSAAASETPFLHSLPRHVRDNYLEFSELLLTSPQLIDAIGAMSEGKIVGTLVALAYPEIVGNPTLEEKLDAARIVRLWHMIHEVDDLIPDWPLLVDMTNEEILARVEADRDAGLIRRPKPEV